MTLFEISQKDLTRHIKVGWVVGVQGEDPNEYIHAKVIDPWNPDTKTVTVKSMTRWAGNEPFPTLHVDGKEWKITSVLKQFSEPMTVSDMVSRGHADKFVKDNK